MCQLKVRIFTTTRRNRSKCFDLEIERDKERVSNIFLDIYVYNISP